MAAAGDKTEKATPKRRDKARKQGQIARSHDLNSVLGLAATIGALSIVAPSALQRLEAMLHDGLVRTGQPGIVRLSGLTALELSAADTVARVLAPIAVAAIVAAVVSTALQTRLRLTAGAMKPSFSKLSPLNGIKRLVGPQAAVEASKATLKVLILGGVVGMSVWSEIHSLPGLVGAPPAQMLALVGGSIKRIAFTSLGLLLPLGIADFLWQRRRIEKQLRMTKQEVKEEGRQTDMPPEARGAIRRRQREQWRKRMMAAVASADVVIANPTHFAVALTYDGTKPAPEMVAKGADLVAAEIRRIAAENDVPIVEDPPLARALYRDVEIGQLVPEEFFVAVAEVIAAVFRRSGKLRRLGLA